MTAGVCKWRAAVLYRKVSYFSDELLKYISPHRRLEAHVGGIQVQRHRFSSLALHGVSGQVNVVTALLLGKYPRFALNRKPGKSHGRFGKCGTLINS